MNRSAIKELIGEPWSYPDNHCWAVFKKASRLIFGVEVSDVWTPESWDLESNREIFKGNAGAGCWPEIDKPVAGCAVLFNNRRGDPIHIGLYIEGGNVLHCPGTPQYAETTRYDNLKQLKAIYPSWKFYAYAPDLHN